MSKWITKRNVLIASLLMVLAFVLSVFVDATCDYGAGGLCAIYWERVRELTEILLISIPLFVVATIVYFLRDEFFNVWIKFALIWVPLTVLLTLIAPEYGEELFPIEKGTVAAFFSVLFIIISLGIMIFKSSSTKLQGKK